MRQLEIFRHLDAVETIINQHLIPFVANVAKALVTLVVLATKGLVKISYIIAIFTTNQFATVNNNNNHEDTKITDANQETNVSVSIPIFKDSDNIDDSEIEEAVDLTENIIDIVQSVNLVKPIVNSNYMESFINSGLRDKLSENYLAATTYKLPKNKRVRSKTHKRFKDLGVMKEHYWVLMATGVLC